MGVIIFRCGFFVDSFPKAEVNIMILLAFSAKQPNLLFINKEQRIHPRCFIMATDTENSERRESDRRQEEDRRESAGEYGEDEQRHETRRIGLDRRRCPHGLIFSTNESYRVMEDWLDENCQGEWSLGLEELSETLDKTSYRLMFEHESDKRLFVEDFARAR